MKVIYISATPELQRKYKEQSGSNASDFIRFDDGYYSLVALVAEKPIALIVAKKRHLSEPLHMEQEAYIDIIEVQPEYQKQGIGTELMEKVIVWAKANQVYQIRAWSEEIRCEALMLWHKLGYTFSRVDFQQGNEKRYGFYVTKRL